MANAYYVKCVREHVAGINEVDERGRLVDCRAETIPVGHKLMVRRIGDAQTMIANGNWDWDTPTMTGQNRS